MVTVDEPDQTICTLLSYHNSIQLACHTEMLRAHISKGQITEGLLKFKFLPHAIEVTGDHYIIVLSLQTDLHTMSYGSNLSPNPPIQ